MKDSPRYCPQMINFLCLFNRKLFRLWVVIIILLFTSGCGYQLYTPSTFALPLKQIYIQTPDPYGSLAKYLQENMRLANFNIVDDPAKAKTILVITADRELQEFLSVNANTQTRQYRLSVVINFELTDNKGRILLPTQSLAESRVVTIEANQILGSSNQTDSLNQQMRRILAGNLLFRLNSQEVTDIINKNYIPN